MERRVLLQADEQYVNKRIPGLYLADSGTLFAVCEARREWGDWSKMNILLLRSTDGGKTWQTILVVDEDKGGYVEMQADDERKQLYLLYEEEWGVKQWFVTVSYDELLRNF